MKLLITPEATVVAIYSDKLNKLDLGEKQISRATEVEFNNATQQWEAFDLKTGEMIASGVDRDKVIEQEKQILESKLAQLHA